MQLSEELRGAVAGALRSSGGAAEMLDILASVDSPPGNVWYVDPDTGSDGFAGLSWTEPFATMTVAVAAAEAGDTIKFRGTIAEATITVAVDNLTIRGANPAVGSSHGAGNVWMEAAAAQTELVIVTGSNCRFSNTCFRGPSAPGVTNYTKGVCIRLSGCYGTQFVGCRFQGRAGSLAAIYSATATSDDVDIIDCEFLYWNTLTYGAAILGASTGGLAYSGWRIIDCTFNSCVIAIAFNAKCCEIRCDRIMEFGTPAAPGGAIAAVLAMGIDLRSTSGGGGGGNCVVGNYLDGAYTATLYKVNADVSGSDNWIGNYAIAGTGATYGVTFANPA